MGVPKFFRYMAERYPCLIELVKEYQMPEFDNMYLDMNGIIHNCSHPDDNVHFRITDEKIFKDIFYFLEFLFAIIKPKKLFFMAIDGVAPRAKMNQQRGRRFRTAKDALESEAKAKARGEKLPDSARFDSNCITPGTVFMVRLQEQLKYFIVNKISTDPAWRNCKIILSGHETPGEGEHKIMDYIRYMKAQDGYDPNTRHCLFGLDADLVMLGLCTHEKNFCLLREEVKFSRNNSKTTKSPDEINFFLLHISLMREYLEMEFSPLKSMLSFLYDMDKIIDDWVLMGFLIGNDFIPHLPCLHIQSGAFPILYKIYMEVLPTLDGYINEAGTLNLKRFEIFLKALSEREISAYEEENMDLKYFESKTARSLEPYEEEDLPNPKLKGLTIAFADEDWEDSEDTFQAEFRLHKRDYYINKMNYEEVTPEVLKSQAEGYVTAIQWNLNYYYNGVCSWSWFYPHHYAPYITDIKDFADMKIEFDLGKPFQPYEQLLGVLPQASKKLLPKVYHDLMTSDDSPIKDFYPVDFEMDLNGKKNDWEALVLIPFIQQDRLLNAMAPCNKLLTDEEIKRNTHGPFRIYEYSLENLGVYEAPEYFPSVKNNYAKCTTKTFDEIMLPEHKLVKGVYPGRNHLHCPGFSTFSHLEYTSQLKDAKIKVFDQPSRYETLIVSVKRQYDPDVPIEKVAEELIGKTVNVQWPHLVQALVTSVYNSEQWMFRMNDNKIFAGNEPITDSWKEDVRSTISLYENRLGINIPKSSILVQVKVLTGRKYVYVPGTGRLNLEKQWQSKFSYYPLDIVVKDIPVYEKGYKSYYDLGDVFNDKATCFYLGHPGYGSMCEVYDSENSFKKGRVKIKMSKIEKEPNMFKIMQAQNDVLSKYMYLAQAASILRINPPVFSKITGCIFVQKSKNERYVNIGLNLKFNKQNKEVPGYTLKRGKIWVYTQRCVELVAEYINFCPQLFHYLSSVRCYESSDSKDVYDVFSIFPKDGHEKLNSLVEWIKAHPVSSVDPRECGGQAVDEENVKMIYETVQEFNKSNIVKQVSIEVKPDMLYKSSNCMGFIIPDSSVEFALFDRVVSCRENYTVPLGLSGTIIGIIENAANKDSDVLYEVIFDEEFTGAAKKCGIASCYTLTGTSIINRSYGLREYQRKVGKPGQLVSSVYENSNSTASQVVSSQNFGHDSQQSSAFASWNKNRANISIFPNFSNLPKEPTTPKKDNPNQPAKVPTPGKVQILQKPQNLPNTPGSPKKSIQNEQQKKKSPVKILKKLDTDTTIPVNELNLTPEVPMENLLKKMLKIGEQNSEAPSTSNSAMAPPSSSTEKINLQDIFAHAKTQNLPQPILPPHIPTVDRIQKPSHPPESKVTQLISIYQAQGIGYPNFKYFTVASGLYQAELLMPNGKSLFGKRAPNAKLACENVAEEALKIMAPHKKEHFPQTANVPVDLIPHPPQQWRQTQPKIQVKHPSQLFYSPPKSQETPPDKNQQKNPAQLFVPLQAVKRSKATSNRNDDAAKDNAAHQSGNSVVNHVQPTEHTNASKKTPKSHQNRNRKSRIAANFQKAQ